MENPDRTRTKNGRWRNFLEPVQKLLRVFRVWPDGVVPLGTDVVSGELDVFEFSF